MCGIIGASSPVELNTSDIKLLYLMAENRGKHSCGFTDTYIIRRMVDTPDKFICEDIFKKKYKQFIGHTRHATVGDKDDIENVHPFQFKKVIGVHNGTIYNHKELQKTEETSFTVDSKALYYLINKYGLKRTLPKLEGKLALAYYDILGKDHDKWVLNLFRFDRPLHIGYKGEALFYASEEDYLKSIGCENIEKIPENVIYQIRQGKIISTSKVAKKYQPKEHVIESSIGFDTTYTKSNGMVINKSGTYKPSVMHPKPKRHFRAPVYAEMVRLETRTGEYFKLFWFDPLNYNKVFVETDELNRYYYHYNLERKEGREVLKKEHEDIYDEIMEYQATLKIYMVYREEAEADANDDYVSEDNTVYRH